MPTRRRRPSTSGRRKTGKNHSLLRSLLTLLIVLLSLAAIAFAASYVYQRQVAKKETAAQEAVANVPPQTNDDQTLEEDYTPASNQEDAATLSIYKLEGTWISTANGAMMTIKGETFSIDFPSVEYAQPMKGKIKVENETAVFTASKASDECGVNEGIYTYKLTGEDLFLRLKKDACRPRTSQLATKWYKL